MVTEKSQDERLKKLGINIKTKYKVDEGIKERNTDDTKNDTINSGIIIEKDYYKGILLKKENTFDSRITYTYNLNDEKEFNCKNCGMSGTIKDFEGECPYCHTNYNIDYEDKELGSKHYYDYVIKDKSYIIKTYLFDFMISLLLVSLYIIPKSRTLYIFDILKILVISLVVSLILFYIFYYLDAFILLPNLKRKKEKDNKKQKEFWLKMNSLGIDKIKFFNNVNYELREYYYSDKNPNIIDFDIIDYDNFIIKKVEDTTYIEVLFDIREVEYINSKILSKRKKRRFQFKRLKDYNELKEEVNHIICPSCGASIDARISKCSYCGKEINYLQEWYLEKNKI